MYRVNMLEQIVFHIFEFFKMFVCIKTANTILK